MPSLASVQQKVDTAVVAAQHKAAAMGERAHAAVELAAGQKVAAVAASAAALAGGGTAVDHLARHGGPPTPVEERRVEGKPVKDEVPVEVAPKPPPNQAPPATPAPDPAPPPQSDPPAAPQPPPPAPANEFDPAAAGAPARAPAPAPAPPEPGPSATPAGGLAPTGGGGGGAGEFSP